jgi:hypothetical protein
MKNGVPFEVAFGIAPENRATAVLDDVERRAASIVFGMFEGHKFNFDTMQFEKPGD